MIFNATIINHTTPAVSVKVADSSGVTYNQVKESLGNQIYEVQGFYLYSTNTSQLIGTIQYQRYDSTGHQDITNIATVVNPYQNIGSLVVDLGNTPIPIILNGQSSVATTILAQTSLQIKFLSKRITNSFGMNLNNFRDMQRITNTEFFDNYGNSSIEEIQDTNKGIKNSIKSFDGGRVEQLRAEEAEYDNMSNPKDEIKRKEIYDKYDKLITPLIRSNKSNVRSNISPIGVATTIAIASAGAYLLINYFANGSKRS
jgi:hypothetical protein